MLTLQACELSLLYVGYTSTSLQSATVPRLLNLRTYLLELEVLYQTFNETKTFFRKRH
jgi:hypothetical protein